MKETLSKINLLRQSLKSELQVDFVLDQIEVVFSIPGEGHSSYYGLRPSCYFKQSKQGRKETMQRCIKIALETTLSGLLSEVCDRYCQELDDLEPDEIEKITNPAEMMEHIMNLLNSHDGDKKS